MTKDELQTLRGLCERAVSGPWHTQPDGAGMTEVYSDKLQRDGLDIGVAGDLREHDAAFIAAARTALPALIDRVEELERERDEARNRVLRPLTEREVQAALHEGRAEAMAATGDNAWTSLLTARDKLAAECERLRALVNRAADSLDYCVQRHGEYNKSVRGDELRAAAKEGLT